MRQGNEWTVALGYGTGVVYVQRVDLVDVMTRVSANAPYVLTSFATDPELFIVVQDYVHCNSDCVSSIT